MTFHSTWAYVLVGCISGSLVGASNLTAYYPPLWKESPGQLSEYRIEDGKYNINPWNYSERLGLYKILVKQTVRYFEKFAPGNEQNILWGLAAFYGWQYHTGRLADPTHRTDCGHASGDHLCISVDSWWGDLNYFLSVIPFLAAIDSGIMELSSDITLQLPSKDQEKFCYDISSCHSSFPEAMKVWNKLYQQMKLPSSTFDDLVKGVWEAHLPSLIGNFLSRSKYYSKLEADFQRNWALFVDYLTALRFPTTLRKVSEFVKGLPQRILVDQDAAFCISDFTCFQNIVLHVLRILHKMHEYTGTLPLTVWKSLMKSKFARQLFLAILEFLLHTCN